MTTLFLIVPPTNNMLIQSAFLLSDYYLIPTIMDNVSTRGVVHYVSSINKVYQNYCVKHEDSDFMSTIFREKPKLLGVFETLYKYNVKNGEIIDNLDEELRKIRYLDLEQALITELGESNNRIIFDTKISNYADIARSTAYGKINSRAAEYRNLTIEILERIEYFEQG